MINYSIDKIHKFNCMENLNRYYDDIKKYPSLTIEEERKLFKLIQDKDKKLSSIARDKIIKCNQRFVVFVAKYYSNNELILDLIEEGNIGLMKAIDAYSIKNGAKFSSFCVHYIKKEILKYIEDNSFIVKRPSTCKYFKAIEKINDEFFQKHQRYPSKEEIEEILSKEKGKTIKNISNISVLSIDEDSDCSELTDINKFALIDKISANNSYNSWSEDFKKIDSSIKEELNRLLIELTPREKRIIILLYGLNGVKKLTANEVAKKEKITKERIYQIKISACKKLKRLKPVY